MFITLDCPPFYCKQDQSGNLGCQWKEDKQEQATFQEFSRRLYSLQHAGVCAVATVLMKEKCTASSAPTVTFKQTKVATEDRQDSYFNSSVDTKRLTEKVLRSRDLGWSVILYLGEMIPV